MRIRSAASRSSKHVSKTHALRYRTWLVTVVPNRLPLLPPLGAYGRLLIAKAQVTCTRGVVTCGRMRLIKLLNPHHFGIDFCCVVTGLAGTCT